MWHVLHPVTLASLRRPLQLLPSLLQWSASLTGRTGTLSNYTSRGRQAHGRVTRRHGPPVALRSAAGAGSTRYTSSGGKQRQGAEQRRGLRGVTSLAPPILTQQQGFSPQQQSANTLLNPADAPTAVPRSAGVTDGIWSKADAALVQQALTDAQRRAKRAKDNDHGVVLLGSRLDELKALAAADQQPAYRAKQLQDGVMHGARSIDSISNVPKSWREQLKARGVRTGRSLLHSTVTAKDGTRKFLLQLKDGRLVEAVGIPAEEGARLTVCVSSQVGCPMRCGFCATGKGGFARNLAAYEIIDQVLTVQEEFGHRVSNVVYMGMGEPLLNLPSVIRSLQVLNQDVGIGARHITISTVGVPNAIMKLASLNLQSTLAISIHAGNQALREQLIPSAKVYPLEALMMDCREYFNVTGRRVTFEYTLLAGINDAQAQAVELARLLKRFDLRSHVNLIPWNPVDESEFSRPSNNMVRAFASVLEEHHVPTSIRITRGLEAAAACGQLRNAFQKQPLESFAVPA